MKRLVISMFTSAVFVACGGTQTTGSTPPPPPTPVASVTVTISPSSAMPGGSAQATATPTSSSGTPLTGRSVSWTSSNSAVASVSSGGGVAAIAEGTATITATAEGVSGGTSFTVTPRVAASVTVALGLAALDPGATTTATATVRDNAGTPLPGRTVIWSSSDPAIGTVAASGQVTAVAPGTTNITATSEGISGFATLTVTAPPAQQWVMYPGSPVLAPSAGQWNSGMVAGPEVVMFRDTLRMWFEGSSAPQLDGVIHLGYAWSTDGIVWHEHSAPVLSATYLAWDYPHLVSPNVLVDGDTLRMWYGGGDVTGVGMRIGYAVSVDGINWTRNPDPVMSGDQSWNSSGVVPGGVIKERGGGFKMWFSGGVGPAGYPTLASKWSIGLATSPDGIHWTAAANPVLAHGAAGEYDQNLALAGTVRETTSGYELWYTGSRKEGNYSVAGVVYATSQDGMTWIKQGLVLSGESGIQGFGTAYYAPHVVFDAGKFHMWFAAWHPGPTIGYATYQP